LAKSKSLLNLNFLRKAPLLRHFLLAPFYVCVSLLHAQSVNTFIGARGTAMGNTSSCIANEWSMFNNVGGLSKTTTPTTAFSYEARPALTGANRMAFVFASPLKIGTAGFGLFRFGDDVYSEQIISAGYGNTFGLASLGVKVNYIQYRADGFGSKGLVSISAGGIAQLTPKLSIGVHIVNLTQQKISNDYGKEYLPTILVVGIGLKASEKVFVVTEIEKDLSYASNVKAGLEYWAHKKFAVRTGFNSYPSSGFLGFGFKPKKFTLDYAYRYEPNLGGSHQATVSYVIKSK
jgi:hypothetical protein